MIKDHHRLTPEEHDPLAPPKQWLPSAIRWPLRLLVLPFVWIDGAMQRLAQCIIRPPYQKKGHCLKRGTCCQCILLPNPKGPLTRFFYFWNTQVNGFFLRQPRPIVIQERRMVVMGCRHLRQNGTCNAYRTRPALCRQWPRISLLGPSALLKGCGYLAAPRKKN